MKRIAQKLVNSFDVYGEPVQLNYRGQFAYKTKIGSLATLATYGLMLAFTYSKVDQLINRLNPSITKPTATLDLINDSANTNLKDNKFELAIGLVFDPEKNSKY